MNAIKMSEKTSFYAECLIKVKNFVELVSQTQRDEWGDNDETDEKLSKLYRSASQTESAIIEYMSDSIRNNISVDRNEI